MPRRGALRVMTALRGAYRGHVLFHGRVGSGLSRAAGTVVAAVCLLGAAAIVFYGLYLLAF